MGGITIDTLTETNIHERRQCIQMVLTLHDLDEVLDEDGKPKNDKDHNFAVWKVPDTNARAIIGLTLESEQLEHASGCKTTAEMWTTHLGDYQRERLMNQMKAPRTIYTVKKNVREGMLGCINRVCNLGENLKAMSGELKVMNVALSVLNGLTSKYENLLVALDAKSADDLSLDFVDSRRLQEGRRQADKSPATKRIGDMALVGANYRGQGRRGDLSRIECYYCQTFGHNSDDCPVLKPRNKKRTWWPRWLLTTLAIAMTPSVCWAMRLTVMTSPSRGSSILWRLHTCAACTRASMVTRRPRDAALPCLERGP